MSPVANPPGTSARNGTPKVLITWPDYPIADGELGVALEKAGLALRMAPRFAHRIWGGVPDLAADVQAAIVSTDPFDASVFACCRELRVIARVGVGIDSIDLAAASTAGVAVTTTPGLNDSTVADHTIAMMLAVLRRVVEHDRAVRDGHWRRTGAYAGWDLAGATIGLVGYGRTAKQVARRLVGFDARILVSDPREPRDLGVDVVDLETLLRSADVISIHTPLLPSTRGLIGEREFAQMKPTAVLVNCARGGVVDEDAMIAALRSGALRAAALDVFEHEPPRSGELLALANVVVTPHTAGISDRSVNAMLRHATDCVLAVMQGHKPLGLLNPEALRRRMRSVSGDGRAVPTGAGRP
jgi:phosphoglycerate dehydrogenase-like enzyme